MDIEMERGLSLEALDTPAELSEGQWSDDSFVSAASFAVALRLPSSRIRMSLPKAPQDIPRLKSTNANKLSQFQWLRGLLTDIVEGRAANTCYDNVKNCGASPLFVVAGTCPNSFCGMQAVQYCQLDIGGLDFWWIKPQADNPAALERATLSLHETGPHKNAAGKARAVYQPLADKFKAGLDGDFSFGVDGNGRAYIDDSGSSVASVRMYIYLVWQETWSSMMARKKFIKGKMLYQKSPGAQKFHSRQYIIQDGQLSIGTFEEEVSQLLPGDQFQDMYVMEES